MRQAMFVASLVFLFAPAAVADKYDDEAKALLRDLDDKKNPVLPELEKASPDAQRDVFRNVATEADDCLAYYYSLGYCTTNPETDKPQSKDDGSGTDILQLLKHDEREMYPVAIAMTAAGGLDRNTIKSTMDMDIRANAVAIHNDCGNLSVITEHNKTHFCKSLAHDPADRLRYWMKLNRK